MTLLNTLIYLGTQPPSCGEIVFSKERIEQWIDENTKEFKELKVNIL